jgi:hypothetical protein
VEAWRRGGVEAWWRGGVVAWWPGGVVVVLWKPGVWFVASDAVRLLARGRVLFIDESYV